MLLKCLLTVVVLAALTSADNSPRTKLDTSDPQIQSIAQVIMHFPQLVAPDAVMPSLPQQRFESCARIAIGT